MSSSLPRMICLSVAALLSTGLRAEPGATPEALHLLARVSKGATEIVVGEVEQVETRAVDQGRRLMTRVHFRVERRLRGGRAQLLTLLLPGGNLGGIGQRVGGVPQLVPGDRLLLFLAPGGAGEGAQPSAPLALTLLGASLWRIEDDAALLSPEAVRLVARPGSPPPAALRISLTALEALLPVLSEPGRQR